MMVDDFRDDTSQYVQPGSVDATEFKHGAVVTYCKRCGKVIMVPTGAEELCKGGCSR
jgi:hypothetical protein